MTALPLIAFFKDIDKNDIPLVGGKGANLGEMTQTGFPVPDGFAVTVPAYEMFIQNNNSERRILDILKVLDINDPEQLNQASKDIKKIILTGKYPDIVAKDIIKAYKHLSGRFGSALVAARSSATAEDLPKASFAGQQETFLNIKGEANLLVKVRECWASLFTPRAIFYRSENKIPQGSEKISVIVQKMVQSESSGVMFSIDPVSNQKDRIVIEAVWGLGETIVQGSVVPDTYVVQKETFSILSKEISNQSVQLIRKGTETKEREVSKKFIGVQKISDADIVTLARLADKLHQHYYFPQDIEWAKEKGSLGGQGKIYIVQTRPVTTLTNNSKLRTNNLEIKTAEIPILSGAGSSPGIGTGPVKILKSPKEISKIKEGDVLVAPMTSPDYVPAMKKAAAIVTDQGGQTSHAAIVSREMGIPCVVGTKNATKILKEGNIVTVDGKEGKIYLGTKIKVLQVKQVEQVVRARKIKTATKLYVNLAEPEQALRISKLNVDGVGLLRAEFIMANIGIHPKEAIKRKTQVKFIARLADDLSTFCKHFKPRPIIYRATDFKTNEYRSLEGGKFWEPQEPNPMLGYRGAFRYVSDPEVFNLELAAIKMVREKHENFHLMIPFVRSPEELARVRRLVATEGLFKNPSFKFWMMVELPVNVILLKDFIKVGIDGVSIGSNDLTMLIEGTDRDNSEVSQAFNELSPAVLWAIKRVIKICNKHHITSSICGQSVSVYDSLVELLVKKGITSVSVNPDAINRVRGVILNAEAKMVEKLN